MRLHLLWIGMMGLIGLTATTPLAQPPDYDLVINGGRVIDPETKLDAVRSVGIKQGKIVAVSEKPLVGQKTIDATGLIVAPGFVDLHAHGQSIAADRMQAFDGVTTTLELETGNRRPDTWYKAQAKTGRVLNYGVSVGWLAARQSVSASKVATEEQLKRILIALEQGLKEGGIGIGCPAGYAPDHGYKEMLAVHELAAKYKVPTFTHVRNISDADPKSSVQAYGELISYAAATGAHVHICHLNSTSGRDISLAARLIRGSQKSGAKITVEAYPWGAGNTSIGSVIMSRESLKRMGVAISDLEYHGKPLNDELYDKMRNGSPTAAVIVHLLRLPRDQEFLDESVLFPGGIIASDAGKWDGTGGKGESGKDWPLPATAFAHPRSAATFTKFLAEYVRDRKKETLLEGIARCTYRPATILEDSTPAFKSKGRLQAGMDADIIVFDLAGLKVRATYTEPHHHTLGMKHVLVNGVAVISDGELDVKAFPGIAVKR